MGKFISDAIVSARTGEPLEREISKRGVLRKQLLELKDALDLLEQTQVSKTVYEQVQNAWIEYGNIYAKEAYRLGVKDGIEIGKEQKIGREKTVLSYKDMVILVKIYDAVKKLNITLLGGLTFHSADEGVLGTLEMIYTIMEHGICEELKLSGSDEVAEQIINILDDDASTTSEKAKKLLGVDEKN